jgi:hypothetical protein
MTGDVNATDRPENPRDNAQDSSNPVKPTRSYRACINCRTHKTKCDLGDVNNPISPPCSRCKRERKECVFGESRRGGRANIEAGLAKRKATSEAPRDTSEAANGGLQPEDARNGGEPRGRRIPGARGEYAQSPAPASRTRLQDPRNTAGHPPIQPARLHQATNHHMAGQPNRQFSPLATYNEDSSYIPMFGPIVPTVPQPFANALSPSTIVHTQTGSNGFPLGMNDIDMSFVFNSRNASGLMAQQNTQPTTGTLPSAGFVDDSANNNIPTGPSFSGFFASPDVPLDPGTFHDPARGRQAESTPKGIPSDPEHHSSSMKTRRMSSSTNDSTAKERVHNNEKLALKDPRSFVINAGMHNESDALQILAMAAETQNPKKRKRDASLQADSPNVENGERAEGQKEATSGNAGIAEREDSTSNWKSSRIRRRTPTFRQTHDDAGPSASRVTFRESTSSGREPSPTPPPDITQFFLVEQGIVDPEQVHSLCRAFFDKHHHYFVSSWNRPCLRVPVLMTRDSR